MKVVGIIAEYNPFHHGHAYQLEQVRKQTNADVILVLMSGNVVQRGEFAMLDKWTRSALAVQSGADIVIELPLNVSLQSADYFAKYAIDYLSRLGVDAFAFGTEEASLLSLESFITDMEKHQDELDQLIQTHLRQGRAYPASVGLAIDSLELTPSFDTNQSNHLLAVQYLKANRQLKRPLSAYAIPRSHNYKSGSQIRKAYFDSQLKPTDVPKQTFQALNTHYVTRFDDYFDLLKYQLSVQSAEQLKSIAHMREGFENLLLKQDLSVDKFDLFVDQLTSLRWTKTAVQRILMSVLLNITQQDFQSFPKTLRLLSFNQKGRRYLNQRQRYNSIELMNNYNQSQGADYHLNQRSDTVYRLANPLRIQEQTFNQRAQYFD